MSLTPVVARIARRLHSRLSPYASFEDLQGEGWIGAIQAVDRFDGRGELSDYAHRRIRGAMIDYIRVLSNRSRDDERAGIPIVQPISLSGTTMSRSQKPEQASSEEEDMQIPGPARDLDRELLAQSKLAALNRRQRYICEQIYWADRTQAELSIELGVNHTRISQLHSDSIKKMRNAA